MDFLPLTDESSWCICESSDVKIVIVAIGATNICLRAVMQLLFPWRPLVLVRKCFKCTCTKCCRVLEVGDPILVEKKEQKIVFASSYLFHMGKV